MGQRLIGTHLRQARETPTDVVDVRRSLPGVWRENPVEFCKLRPQWWCGSASGAESPIMLSLFGGVGECAKAFTHLGGAAVLIDFENCTENDLSKHASWNDISVQLPKFNLVGIDLPCNTGSRARRGGPGSGMPNQTTARSSGSRVVRITGPLCTG